MEGNLVLQGQAVSDTHRNGDKVRIRSGPLSGSRGEIKEVSTNTLTIALDNNTNIVVPEGDITNYSLAARRAWKKMPKKAGRPKLDRPRKHPVTVRLDIDVLDALSRAVDLGLIDRRGKAINQWLRERLSSLIVEPRATSVFEGSPLPDSSCGYISQSKNDP